jgi:hypothetical protein
MPRKTPDSVSFASAETIGLVEVESTKWVKFQIAQLEGEGRPIEGGWPGTVTEARRRLINCFAKLAKQPSHDAAEVTLLVDMLYGNAKEKWLLHSR